MNTELNMQIFQWIQAGAGHQPMTGRIARSPSHAARKG